MKNAGLAELLDAIARKAEHTRFHAEVVALERYYGLKTREDCRRLRWPHSHELRVKLLAIQKEMEALAADVYGPVGCGPDDPR